MNIRRLADRLGYTFADPCLLEAAVTHRSFGASNNERLEFLGDAVLGAVIADLLFRQFPSRREGELSRGRASLVRQDGLLQIARDLSLNEYLRLGEGERRAGGCNRPSILADAVEGIIGAVYLDGGYAEAQALVTRFFGSRVQALDSLGSGKDAKTTLQELLQSQRLQPPTYTLLATRGQDHDQEFEVECQVHAQNLSAIGIGRSRRIAEQIAAGNVLDQLKDRCNE